MKADLVDFQKNSVGEVVLDPGIFGLKYRQDLIKRVFDWQRAKKMTGNHSAKDSSEVSCSTRKPFRQKGTGNARQGNIASPILRGGGVAHGPVVRSHAVSLPKKIRSLGLRHALSMKYSSGRVFFINSLKLDQIKTKIVEGYLAKFGKGNFCAVDSWNDVDKNLKLSARSLKNFCVLPTLGINVYDLLKYDFILFSQESLEFLNKRFNFSGVK